MPKVTWGVDPEEPEDLEGFEPYDGNDPPKGVYIWTLELLRVKINRNGDKMLNGLLVCADERPGKKQYKGFPLWFNQNVTEQGKPYVKQFLNALGVSWSDFYSKSIFSGKMPKTNEDDPVEVEKIGRIKFNRDDPPMLRASIRRRRDNDDMELQTFLPWKELDEEEDEDEEEDYELEDEVEEAEDEEEEADEDEDEEPEEEAPKPRSTRSRGKGKGKSPF